MEDHFTCQQAADKLHCSEQTVWRYIRAGRLKAKTGKKPYLISESALQAFLDSIGQEDGAG